MKLRESILKLNKNCMHVALEVVFIHSRHSVGGSEMFIDSSIATARNPLQRLESTKTAIT